MHTAVRNPIKTKTIHFHKIRVSFSSELYYKNVNVTQRQENVNEALKQICCLLDASPWELGVLSTSKGLIAGPLQIHLPDDVVIDCGNDTNGNVLKFTL